MVAQNLPSTFDVKGAGIENGVVSQNGMVAEHSNENDVTIKTLPKGKYTLVGIDIDTTGRRLIDEIVQLAAFTPSDRFGQYIMPYMNLNPAARQRHQVRVISIGYYRMLTSTQTYKIIKSKSEYAALKDFLDWLEALRAKDTISNGVILVYYEERKFIPYMILEAFKKYKLLDRFLKTVKSFANGCNLAKSKADGAFKSYTLRKLAMHLKDNAKIEQNNNMLKMPTTSSEVGQSKLPTSQQQSPDKIKWYKTSINSEREQFDGNANVRAKLAYEVAFHLSNFDTKESLDSANAFNKMLVALQPYCQSIEHDLNEIEAQNKNLERQNSFRPVFLNYFKSTLYHRLRAVKFRIILAENIYDLPRLSAIWSEQKRDGILLNLQNIAELKCEEKTELADLFDSYFDPAKTTIKPVVPINNGRRRNRQVRNKRNISENYSRSNNNEQNGADNMPDSTTKSPKNQNDKGLPRLNNNVNFSKTQASTNLTTTANQEKNATATSMNAPASN